MASLTLYLRPAGLTVDILGTFCGVFMVQCVCIQLMLRFFLHSGLYCLTVLLVAKI